MQIGSSAAKRVALLVGLVVLTAIPSYAVPVTLDVFIDDVSVASLDETQLGCVDTSAITANCSVQGLTIGGLQLQNVSLSLDTDPIVSSEIAVQNLTAATQRYTLVVTLPVAPIFGSAFTGGSTSGGVTDNDGAVDPTSAFPDFATLSTPAGSAFYTAMVDGVAYQFLFPNPTVLGVTSPFESAVLTPEGAFGTPIPSQLRVGNVNSIGIRYDFRLTAQDAASFTGVFVVQPVPEPGTALLVGLGLAAVARASRRR